MKDYAAVHSLGAPTLLFAQGTVHWGVALDWRDYRRAFTFNRATWTLADYQKLCDLLRAW